MDMYVYIRPALAVPALVRYQKTQFKLLSSIFCLIALLWSSRSIHLVPVVHCLPILERSSSSCFPVSTSRTSGARRAERPQRRGSDASRSSRRLLVLSRDGRWVCRS
jgi:hypothetical protein